MGDYSTRISSSVHVFVCTRLCTTSVLSHHTSVLFKQQCPLCMGALQSSQIHEDDDAGGSQTVTRIVMMDVHSGVFQIKKNTCCGIQIVTASKPNEITARRQDKYATITFQTYPAMEYVYFGNHRRSQTDSTASDGEVFREPVVGGDRCCCRSGEKVGEHSHCVGH
ncbi:hypothetical protein CBL_06619 [Carabus blaptoides fortunei]